MLGTIAQINFPALKYEIWGLALGKTSLNCWKTWGKSCTLFDLHIKNANSLWHQRFQCPSKEKGVCLKANFYSVFISSIIYEFILFVYLENCGVFLFSGFELYWYFPTALAVSTPVF